MKKKDRTRHEAKQRSQLESDFSLISQGVLERRLGHRVQLDKEADFSQSVISYELPIWEGTKSPNQTVSISQG